MRRVHFIRVLLLQGSHDVLLIHDPIAVVLFVLFFEVVVLVLIYPAVIRLWLLRLRPGKRPVSGRQVEEPDVVDAAPVGGATLPAASQQHASAIQQGG